MYQRRNNVARSRKHLCFGKATMHSGCIPEQHINVFLKSNECSTTMNFTDRCVKTPDTCLHSIQAIPPSHICIYIYSVLNTNQGPCNLLECKYHDQNNILCHTFSLVTCIRIYIYRRMTGLPMIGYSMNLNVPCVTLMKTHRIPVLIDIMRYLISWFKVRITIFKTGINFGTKNRKCKYFVRSGHVLIFGMPDTSQPVTPFNVLRSHNVPHNYDHATFNLDCCYDTLQHLLCICMSTKVSVKFRFMN
jgi:hypothetical protein